LDFQIFIYQLLTPNDSSNLFFDATLFIKYCPAIAIKETAPSELHNQH